MSKKTKNKSHGLTDTLDNLQEWIIEDLVDFGDYLSDNGDVKAAVRVFEVAAEKGSLYALFWLGCLYKSDLYGMQDSKKAFECFKESAEKGYLYSMFYLVTFYHEGIGTEKNMNEFDRWMDEIERLDPDGSKFKEMKKSLFSEK